MTEPAAATATTTDAVLAVLTKYDPEGLIALGAPVDEYEAEARDLAMYLRTGKPVTETVLIDVWTAWFTSDAHLLTDVSAPARAAIVADLADLPE